MSSSKKLFQQKQTFEGICRPQTACTDAVAPRFDSGACDGVQDRTAGPVGGGCQHGRRLLKAAIAFKGGLRSRLAGQVRMQHFRPVLRKPSAAGRFRQRGRKALPAISLCNRIDAATRCCENRRLILRRPAAPEAARIRCGYEAPHSNHHRPSELPPCQRTVPRSPHRRSHPPTAGAAHLRRQDRLPLLSYRRMPVLLGLLRTPAPRPNSLSKASAQSGRQRDTCVHTAASGCSSMSQRERWRPFQDIFRLHPFRGRGNHLPPLLIVSLRCTGLVGGLRH